MGRIVVVGSVNFDYVLICPHLPQVGETVIGSQFLTAGGGKGANQAVAAARLEADVTFVCRVGTDHTGDQMLAAFQAEGMRLNYATRDDEQPTGQALIFVGPGGNNLLGIIPGSNGTLAPQHVLAAEDAIRRADVLLVQLEVPMDSVRTAIDLARKHRVLTILNPAPPHSLPDEMLQDVILTPNETETAALVGFPIETPQDVSEAATQLVERGAQAVILTLGSRGAFIATPNLRLVIPAFAVEAVDTTAAGDAFNAGLACALARGETLTDAARYASAVGALSVTRKGAQPSLPTAAQVAEFLKTATVVD